MLRGTGYLNGTQSTSKSTKLAWPFARSHYLLRMCGHARAGQLGGDSLRLKSGVIYAVTWSYSEHTFQPEKLKCSFDSASAQAALVLPLRFWPLLQVQELDSWWRSRSSSQKKEKGEPESQANITKGWPRFSKALPISMLSSVQVCHRHLWSEGSLWSHEYKKLNVYPQVTLSTDR